MYFFSSVVSPKIEGGDDIVAVRMLSDGAHLLVLADGATGVGLGRVAAERFVSICLEAWLITPEQVTEITRTQSRKPRIGSGCRIPSVNRGLIAGSLLMSSDGLEYAMSLTQAAEIVLSGSPDPAEEITRVACELHQWGLPDDLGAIVGILKHRPHRNRGDEQHY